MRRRAWAWLALSSLCLAALSAATRPRYGGTLTVELSTLPVDPTDPPGQLLPVIGETMVRVGARGIIEPWLAIAWQHEPDYKRWRFSLRSKVTFHDGEPLNATTAAPALLAALKRKYSDAMVTAGGQTLVVQFEQAVPELLAELTRRDTAIIRKPDGNSVIGTGPFRMVAWDPGRRLTYSRSAQAPRGRTFSTFRSDPRAVWCRRARESGHRRPSNWWHCWPLTHNPRYCKLFRLPSTAHQS
jgi:peptide/nickel transport system substrate-binding protein